jgi:hypothetical protein
MFLTGMAEISEQTQKLIQRYQAWYNSLQKKEGIPVLHVDTVAAKVAAFYEKMRGIIEWKEEHLLRKAAIERMLKRRLFLVEEAEEIAGPLVLELIRGGHFPNDNIEETKVEVVQKVLAKYIFIIKNSSLPKEELKLQLFNWLLGLAACEIEEALDPPRKERALMDYMADLVKERIEVKEGAFVIKGISEEEKAKQIYIAVQKALFKLDSPIISYHLLKFYYYPQWPNLPQEQLEEVAQNIYLIQNRIEKDLKHPLSEKFYQICERYNTPYLILGDILRENPTAAKEKLAQPELLESQIKTAYGKRLQNSKDKLLRAALYSIISIFVTKILLALFIEIPFDKYVTGQFSYFTLGLNVFIPPILMFLMILTIRPPGAGNIQRVILEVMKIVYQSERKDIYQIKAPQKRGVIMRSVLFLFYLLSFFISFGFIIWALQKLEFGVLSIMIFLIFLSLVLFVATRIRHRAKELQVEEEKETILTLFFDFLTLPIVRVGKWLSSQWERYNVLIVLFNILIELPFQLFTEFLEQWRYFLKEKKEEIH